MLGLDVCELGGQFLELLWLTVCYRGEDLLSRFSFITFFGMEYREAEVGDVYASRLGRKAVGLSEIPDAATCAAFKIHALG